LQAIIVAIIANATLSFGKTILKDWRTFLVAGIAAIMFMLHVNPIIVILSAAAGGLVLFKRTQSRSHPAGSSDQKVSTIKPLLLILSASLIGFVHLFFCNRSLFDLAVLLFRIDLFAFGGGFASIPLMLHEIVTVRHWLDDQTFMHAIVLGQGTPGPIVITATFIGYFLYGLTGAVIATVSIFLPSFMAVLGFSAYFDRMRSSPLFNHVIGGVLCSFVGLLLTTTIRFALNANWDIPHLLLAAAALVALLLKVDILWVVLMGTIISMIALA
jgi:chromate transporter